MLWACAETCDTAGSKRAVPGPGYQGPSRTTHTGGAGPWLPSVCLGRKRRKKKSTKKKQQQKQREQKKKEKKKKKKKKKEEEEDEEEEEEEDEEEDTDIANGAC